MKYNKSGKKKEIGVLWAFIESKDKHLHDVYLILVLKLTRKAKQMYNWGFGKMVSKKKINKYR